MARKDKDSPWQLRVYPKDTLLRNALLSFVLILLPLFGALYFLGVPAGTWPMIVVAQLVLTIVALACFVRARLTFVGVIDGNLVERGFLGRMHVVPLSDVVSVVLAETYRTHATDSSPQLLLRDVNGRRLLRLRGIFWSRTNMRAITAFVTPPVEHFPDPVTSQEFFETYPGSASWFEDRPIFAVAAGIAVFVLSLGVILELMSLAGIPISTTS